MTDDDINTRVQLLIMFKDNLENWAKTHSSIDRQWLNENKHRVEHIVTEAGCLKRYNIQPPASVGGYVARNVNPFNSMFAEVNFQNMVPLICDMLDETVGILRNPLPKKEPVVKEKTEVEIRRGYAFVAMPMDRDDHALVDVLATIKEAAAKFEIIAARIDDDDCSERITDRMLESLRRAEFVIVDLTNERPNVLFEAGYAHGIGKTPIYIARDGTKVHFDVYGYPVIFFRNMTELRVGLIRRLETTIASNEGKIN